MATVPRRGARWPQASDCFSSPPKAKPSSPPGTFVSTGPGLKVALGHRAGREVERPQSKSRVDTGREEGFLAIWHSDHSAVLGE